MKTRLLFCIFLILMITISCNRKKDINNEKAILYSEYIKTAALNYPFKNQNFSIIHKFPFNDGKNDTMDFCNFLRVKRTSYDNETKLLMNLHKWEYDCHDYPSILIYVTDQKKNNYIIPFFDEQYYLMLNMTTNYEKYYNENIKDERKKEDINYLIGSINSLLNSNLSFQNHLNEILYTMNPKQKFELADKSDSLNQKRHKFSISLIKQVCDLIGLKEIKKKDTIILKKVRDGHYYYNQSISCEQTKIQNINTIIQRLNTTNYLYYWPLRGNGGYWEFEIKNNEYRECRLSAKMINLECYGRVIF